MALENNPLNLKVHLGFPFHDKNLEEFVHDAGERLRNPIPSYYLRADLEYLARANVDDELKIILFYAERVICQSKPLFWLTSLFKAPLVNYVPYQILIPRILELCEKRGHSIYLFGETKHKLLKIVSKLKSKYPNLKIAGYKEASEGNMFSWNNDEILKEISEAKPELVFVALGVANQERWVYSNYKHSNIPLFISVGCDFSNLIGKRTSLSAFFKNLFNNPGYVIGHYWKGVVYLISQALKQRKLVEEIKTKSAPKEWSEKIPDHIFQRIHWSGKIELKMLPNLIKPKNYHKNVLIECSEVTFIDSSGLGELVFIERECKKAGKFFCLLEPSGVLLKALQNMKIEKFITVASSADEIERIVSEHEEALVSIKVGENGHDYILTPLVDLKPNTLKKVEKDIEKVLPTLSRQGKILLNLQYINYIDSTAIGTILKLKNHLNELGIEFALTMVQGSPKKTLKALRLSDILIIPEDIEVI